VYHLPVKAVFTGSREWVDPRDNPVTVLRHAIALLRSEGPYGLIAGVGRFFTAMWPRVYRNSWCRIYELAVDEAVRVEVPAPFEGITLHIVESREDVLKLSEDGCDNLLEAVYDMGRRLDAGAVAACAFVGREFASIDWIAFSKRAKREVEPLPIRVDFENGEAVSGAAFTVRRFRGRGIGTYRVSRQAAYLQSLGYHVCYSTIAVDNVPSQRCVERYGARFVRVGHQRRFLWWSSWSVKAVGTDS